MSCVSIACDCSIETAANDDWENELEAAAVLKFFCEHNAGSSTLQIIKPNVQMSNLKNHQLYL